MTLRSVTSFPVRFLHPRISGQRVLPAGFLLLLFLGTLFPGSAFSQNESSGESEYLKAAIQIHSWLESVRQKDQEGNVVWPNAPDHSKRSSTDLYHGNAGVVRFYLRIHQSTADKKYLALAESGAKRLLDEINSNSPPSTFGLYTGRSGHGLIMVELWQATRKPVYRKATLRCVDQIGAALQEKKKQDPFAGVTDIISGRAGAGIFLLEAHRSCSSKKAIELATKIGDQLIEQAQRGDESTHLEGKASGLRWRVSSKFPREYPNYSHGTAGICDFLVRLDQSLSKSDGTLVQKYDGRFLKAAVLGAEYLISIARVENERCLIFHNTQNGRELYYLGWCHGPSGTQTFFHRLGEATRDARYQKLVSQGAEAILHAQLARKQTPGFWNNLGQCCGSAGVAEFMADQFERTGEKKYLDECRKLSANLLERATKVPLESSTGLKWVHAENRVDPKGLKAQTGYMQGASGIGCWLLRMDQLSQNAKSIQNKKKN